MKITIEPETDDERQRVKPVAFVGIRNVAVIGVTYKEGGARVPLTHVHGNLLDIMRELPVLQYHLSRHQMMIDAAHAKQSHRIVVPERRIPDDRRADAAS